MKRRSDHDSSRIKAVRLDTTGEGPRTGSAGIPLKERGVMKSPSSNRGINKKPSGNLLAVKSNNDTRNLGESTTTQKELQNYVSKIDLLKKTQATVKKLTQLAAFIPDFILKEETSRKVPYQRSADAVVFMVDVSGFTALTEAYSLKGKGGTDQLTKTLMGYIGPLAETILMCDGDIVKYAGDAFLAFWNTNATDYPEDVQRAVDCALYIQEKYGSYLCKEVDITIRVKVGIGAGIVHLCGIGNDSYQHYVCFGPGVEGASLAEKNCTPGEVVLHPSSWNYCNPAHYKVSTRNETYKVATHINTFLNPDKRGRPMRNTAHKTGDMIRPIISDIIEHKSEDFMRRFVIPPVLRKLDDDIPLEYLNESRMVCISFIHIDTVPISSEGVQFRETMTQIVNKCFVKLYTSVTRMQGAVTKVIMFDKGLTYLVVFGLPGYITEHQCAHALKFSHAARRNLLAIRGIEEVSIGVTTGSCYSGVLGHPRRQEYTVMGRKVNKAARLMIYYPARVACDQDTAYHSKLPPSNFELQEYKALKGIADPGKIYEFINSETQEDNSVVTFSYPMVGRDVELKFFKEVLIKSQKDLSEHNKTVALMKGSTLQKETAIAKGVWMIVFEGENGIGKSRMLAACMAEAERQNVQIFSVGMNLMMQGQTMFGLSSLAMDAIGIGGFRTAQEREDYLRKRVQEPDLAAELCGINDILHTKFPLSAKYTHMESLATQSYGQHVLSSLIKVIYPNDIVLFAVDDAHFLDLPSWEYLLAMSKSPHIICLLTLRKNAAGSPKIPESIASQLYHNKNIKVVRLSGLDTVYCKTLACQMMEVAGIPSELEKILIAKSQGVPAWIDQVLHELVRTGVLNYSSSAKKSPMVYVDTRLIEKMESSMKRKTQKTWASDDDYYSASTSKINLTSVESTMSTHKKNSLTLLQLPQLPIIEETDPTKRLLVVKSGTNIGHIKLHGTLHEIVLDSYDELNSNEQIILKCASVLGRKFSRLMVTRILPYFELNASKYESGFNRLMEAMYIRCASGIHSKASANKDQGTIPECFCKESNDPLLQRIDESRYNLGGIVKKKPKYQSCKYMEFAKDTLAEVVYDLMTQDQRKDFHLKAARYLDSSAVKCESCGGHNSSFIYGIVLKASDLGVMDGEDAIRVAANNARKHKDSVVMRFSSVKKGKQRPSLTTQIVGMKKRFQEDGSKVSQVEIEILSLLRKIDLRERRNRRCCGHKNDQDAEQELNEELHLLKDPDDEGFVNLKANPSSKENDSEAGRPQDNGDVRNGTGANGSEVNRQSENVDLRLCECSAIQAKVCIEMVKHYREAQKFGKCMTNLLEAAEQVITIGNGTQGLVHLEDAMGLLKSIKTGKVQRPDKDDKDDLKLEDEEVEGQIEYLNGLAYFELGVHNKSKEYFIDSLARIGLKLTASDNENKMVKESSLYKAKARLFTTRYLTCCMSRRSKNKSEDAVWVKKLRILNYLHEIFKQDKKLEMALLVSIWEVITSERYGDVVYDIIPAYCNMMATLTSMSSHKDAERYEKRSLNIIKDSFGSNEELDPSGLLTTAGLFQAITYSRLCRGYIYRASESAYLGLRIAQTIHDNSLMIRLLPSLIMTLMMGLRIPELIDALQKLWYISEEEDDWMAMAIYYALCLDLLLRTAYPLETFSSCESFVLANDWTAEGNLLRDIEVLFTMEASLALWYARYSRWEQATKWINAAETHRPKSSTFLSVVAEVKLLECQLIFVNHYLDGKRYQHFAKTRNAVKELMRGITKSVKVVPAMKPRFLHLQAYYYKIRTKNVEAEKHMKQAEKLAISMGNELEIQWILHNRTVWSDKAIPTIKFFWLEHTENRVLDWHTSGKIPWANIMYSLPLPS